MLPLPECVSGFLLSNVGLDLCVTQRGSGVCSRPRGSLVSCGEGGDLCFGLVSKVEVCSMQHAAGSVHACSLQVHVAAGRGSSVLPAGVPLCCAVVQSFSTTGR